MGSFLRKGYTEHQRLHALRREFERAGATLGRLLGETAVDGDGLKVMLFPLVDVAWADGRVTAREAETILEVIENAGLGGDEEVYCAVMETLMSRPSMTDSARNWFRLSRVLKDLGDREFDAACDAITVVTRYIAEQSSNNLIGFLRGDGVNRDEETMLRKVSGEIARARSERHMDFPLPGAVKGASAKNAWRRERRETEAAI